MYYICDVKKFLKLKPVGFFHRRTSSGKLELVLLNVTFLCITLVVVYLGHTMTTYRAEHNKIKTKVQWDIVSLYFFGECGSKSIERHKKKGYSGARPDISKSDFVPLSPIPCFLHFQLSALALFD